VWPTGAVQITYQVNYYTDNISGYEILIKVGGKRYMYIARAYLVE